MKKESFELLEDILEDSGELSERVSYEDLVTTKYAREAAENSRLNSTHHFVVNRDQQGAGSDPDKRAGNADGSVSDHTEVLR